VTRRDGPAFTPEQRRLAVEQYMAGRATMRAIAAELDTTTATISRWVKDAKLRGVTATAVPSAPSSAASRVAALAPPPAPPPPPELDLGDGSAAAMIPALLREYNAHLETAKRARAQGDPKAETAARSAAIKTAQEVRQLRAALAEEGGEALAITRDDVEAARLEVRRRLDEIAAAKGETLMWSLDGTPNVTRDGGGTPPRGTGGA
jgi:transposase-like protein